MSTTETKTKTCAACAHWNSEDGTKGECRRNAPQLITFEIDDDTRVESRFPVTNGIDWCGDFDEK